MGDIFLTFEVASHVIPVKFVAPPNALHEIVLTSKEQLFQRLGFNPAAQKDFKTFASEEERKAEAVLAKIKRKPIASEIVRNDF